MDEYIVSARKYRPVSFDSVVGQQALTTTLKNAVKSGKLAHAYLFWSTVRPVMNAKAARHSPKDAVTTSSNWTLPATTRSRTSSR